MAVDVAVTPDEQLVRERLDALLNDNDPRGDPHQFLGAQFDAGIAWVGYPEGYGGLGLSPKLQGVIDSRLRAAGAPNALEYNIIGHGMGSGTIIAHGTEEQKRRYLRPLFTGEEIWCQLFSEPGAGSDVAGLSTRALRDGDEWVVNGQKVWTTVAHLAKWGLLVARTDPEVPKHQGLTYFIIDMEAPGVEVRPLRQMTGEAEFTEVYMTDVRIPDSSRLGAVGEGWRVVITTLMNERVSIGANVPPRNWGAIGEAVRLWEANPATRSTRDDLLRLWTEAEAARLTNIRAQQLRYKGTPGPEGSLAKLVYAELNKKAWDFCVDLLGPEGMLYGSYEMTIPEAVTLSPAAHDLRRNFLRSRANSIEGGTSEIMKNIIGERVLGLPGEPRVDKDLPWSEVPRS